MKIIEEYNIRRIHAEGVLTKIRKKKVGQGYLYLGTLQTEDGSEITFMVASSLSSWIFHLKGASLSLDLESYTCDGKERTRLLGVVDVKR